jgi:hypothetical protein
MRREEVARLASAEGYLAPLFAIPTFYNPILAMLPEKYKYVAVAIRVTLYAFAWLFAVSGARNGKGAARLSASVTLAVLILLAVFSLIVAYLPTLAGATRLIGSTDFTRWGLPGSGETLPNSGGRPA